MRVFMFKRLFITEKNSTVNTCFCVVSRVQILDLLDAASCVVVLLGLFIVLCSASEKTDFPKEGTMVLVLPLRRLWFYAETNQQWQ